MPAIWEPLIGTTAGAASDWPGVPSRAARIARHAVAPAAFASGVASLAMAARIESMTLSMAVSYAACLAGLGCVRERREPRTELRDRIDRDEPAIVGPVPQLESDLDR